MAFPACVERLPGTRTFALSNASAAKQTFNCLLIRCLVLGILPLCAAEIFAVERNRDVDPAIHQGQFTSRVAGPGLLCVFEHRHQNRSARESRAIKNRAAFKLPEFPLINPKEKVTI